MRFQINHVDRTDEDDEREHDDHDAARGNFQISTTGKTEFAAPLSPAGTASNARVAHDLAQCLDGLGIERGPDYPS